MDLIVFDMSVNNGVHAASVCLQQVLGFVATDCDGMIGANTLAALALMDANVLAQKLLDARAAMYRIIAANNPKNQVFLEGWLNRINSLREVAFA